MKNIFKKGLMLVAGCLMANAILAADATFVMGSIFDGNKLSFDVTSPVAANVSSNASKSNAKAGKLGSDGHYFQIVLKSETFTAASINGYINTNDKTKNWAFQFSTDGGSTWSSEVTQANDGNKSAHDITVEATIPSGANGFRVVRRAGTSTLVNSITLTLAGGGSTPTQSSDNTLKSLKYNGTSVPGFSPTTTSYQVTLPSGTTTIPTVTAEANHEKATVEVKAPSASTLPCSVTVQVKAENGDIKNYVVSFAVEGTTPPVLSNDATLKSLTYGGTSVPNFSPSKYDYTIELAAGIKTPPTIAAETNHAKATKNITQAESVPGSGKVDVTAEDGTTKLTYTVNYTAKSTVPSTDLTIHVPEIYEAKEIAGGYGGTLSVFNGREYEVYYATFDNDSHYQVAVTPVQKTTGITQTTSDNYSCKAVDGWLDVKGSTSKSNYEMPNLDEFKAGASGCHKIYNNGYYKLHIKGYDQFSFFAKDNSTTIDPNNASKNKRFQVYIDGTLQPETQVYNEDKIRRYDISTGEHLIEVRGIGASNNYFYAFSLRVAQEPRTKWIKGNDSTQVVLQTAAIQSITYATKYNNIPGAETKLEWIGAKADGIILNKITGELSDTLIISGTANCATGLYNYAVVAYYNGTETSRATGKFKVASDIQATSDLEVEVYQGEEMDQITFKYYALSADDVKLTWPANKPNGITGSGNNGKYIIGGTPTTTGVFPFEITVTGADTIIKGKITVNTLVYGDNAVLYLYKNNLAYEHDGVYNHIKDADKWNPIFRKAKEDGLRPASQYSNYKWVIISEDADANNAEVLAVISGGANLPVLNLKGFTYSVDRLNWGEPDNGAIDSTSAKIKGTYLHVQHANHPIYTAKMNYLKTGDSIQILSGYETKGIMPINVNAQGSLCLATAYTRDIENYFGAGELQTALHEVPADMRGGHKYICLPLAREVTLSNQGKNLIDGIIAYLTSPNASGIEAPTTQINSFSVAGIQANIDQKANTITLSVPVEEYDNLENAHPIIELADPNTHVTPSIEPSIDLRYAVYIPKTFVVSDYINRRAYDLTVEVYDPQGIDEIYAIGSWVNIYDIYGRKVTTTNENIYTMELPRGMYIIVTESGQTIKIMR